MNIVSQYVVSGYKKTLHFLGRVNTRIILSIVFVFFVPLAKILDLFTKKRTNEIVSTWKESEQPLSQSYEDQF
jgi:hypothetical protein